MSGFNFFSHGSQDLFPTYINKGKGLGDHRATVATIIGKSCKLLLQISSKLMFQYAGNCGAIVGGTIAGTAADFVPFAARRLATAR